MFIVDTNVLSESRKITSGRIDPNVLRWLTDANPNDIYMSAITLMEIELGVLMMERRDARQGEILRRWLTSRIMPDFAARLLPIDAAVASRCAQLLAIRSRSERDVWIAATALVHGMTVVTRNVADFEATGVAVLNPWLARSV
jgi:predicted nucleic acid-binding protein